MEEGRLRGKGNSSVLEAGRQGKCELILQSERGAKGGGKQKFFGQGRRKKIGKENGGQLQAKRSIP